MPRKGRIPKIQEGEDVITSRKAVAFVSYQGPNHRVTTAARRLIHQQAMREIGHSRRKHKDSKSVELDLSLLQQSGQLCLTPISWWLGIRWTATDNLKLIANFKVELHPLEESLIANSEEL